LNATSEHFNSIFWISAQQSLCRKFRVFGRLTSQSKQQIK